MHFAVGYLTPAQALADYQTAAIAGSSNETINRETVLNPWDLLLAVVPS